MNSRNIDSTVAFLGLLTGFVIGFVAMGLISVGARVDPDLMKIQRQRNAMRLYEEASK
jgi:type IV secretory pathway TrbD component